MNEFSDEGSGKSHDPAWEELHNNETGDDSRHTDDSHSPDMLYDSEIIPEHPHEDASWPSQWASFDFTPAHFAETPENRDIPYAFGIRQFDGIEPAHSDLADNVRDFYKTESEVLLSHRSYVDRKTIASDMMGEDYDDVMPVISYQHLDLSSETPDGAIKITIDGSTGLMVDFYGADGSVSHNRYYADPISDTAYDEAIFVDRTNRDQLLAHIPALGVIPEAERQQMIANAETIHNDVQAAKKAQRTPVSREELKHVLSLAAEAAPTVVSFYDMLCAAENRANGDNNVSLAASEYAAQAFTDQINAFLSSFGVDTGPAPGGEPRFQHKIITDGPHMGMVVKCGYTERREDRPSQPAAIITLKETLNQAQFHERLPDDVAAAAALYPTGGRSEQRIVLSVIDGRLQGVITKRVYGSGNPEPLSVEHQRFVPDDTHTQLLSKLAQNPQIFNQQTNNR
jgi:hypothetical protein